MSDTKTCTKCGEVKSLDGFYRNKGYAGGYKTQCKECDKAASRLWQKENPDRFKESLRKWRERNPDYHRKWTAANPDKKYYPTKGGGKLQRLYGFSSGPNNSSYATRMHNIYIPRGFEMLEISLTEKEWTTVLEAFDYKCAMCGDDQGVGMDHWIPLPIGPHTKENVVPMCYSCNSNKSARDPMKDYSDKKFNREEIIARHPFMEDSS